jgi:hypothetical protein
MPLLPLCRLPPVLVLVAQIQWGKRTCCFFGDCAHLTNLVLNIIIGVRRSATTWKGETAETKGRKPNHFFVPILALLVAGHASCRVSDSEFSKNLSKKERNLQNNKRSDAKA